MTRQTEVWKRWVALLIFSLALMLAGIVPGHVSSSDAERGAFTIMPKGEVSP